MIIHLERNYFFQRDIEMCTALSILPNDQLLKRKVQWNIYIYEFVPVQSANIEFRLYWIELEDQFKHLIKNIYFGLPNKK